jgi:hypothetical protein
MGGGYLRRRTLTLLRAFAEGMDAISLPRRKEMAKEKTPRRSSWEPPWCAQKLLTLRVTNVFAKMGSFRFCVLILKSK